MINQPATRLGVVGGGLRAQFFLRQTRMMTDRIEVVGVTSRSTETAMAAAAASGAPVRESIAELIAQRPDFVLVAVRREGAADVTRRLVEAGIHVLVETPPAVAERDLLELWSAVGSTGLVQVAEQSMYMPSYSAALAAVRAGVIGIPTATQVSSNHGYHAVAIMRAFLAPGGRRVTIRATSITTPTVTPLIWDQWQSDLDAKPLPTTIATLDFGDAYGLYDFTDLQWFNPLRHRRLLVRGSSGELDGASVVRLKDGAVVPSTLLRRYSGIDMNHEGFDLHTVSLDGDVLFRNPYVGHRVSDEDIAAAALLDAMAQHVRSQGPAPYPLADGSQDHILALAIDESLRTGGPIVVHPQPWASALAQ